MGGTIIKDIRLKPAIGNWFEYQPRHNYAAVIPENIAMYMVDEALFLHHEYAAAICEIIKNKFALSAELHTVVVSQTTYADFIAERGGRGVAAVLETPYGALTCTCEIEFLTALMDRIFGGKGIGKKKAEQLTDIEQIAAKSVFELMLEAYQDSWLHAVSGDLQSLSLYSPKLKFDERIKKDTRVLVYSITIAYGDQPPAALEFMLTPGLFEHIYEIYLESKNKKPRKVSIYLSPESVSNVYVPIDVRLGSTQLSIDDVLYLEPGDVLQLNEKLTDSLLVSIGEADFWGVLGKQKDQYAVKIIDRKSKYYSFQAMESPLVKHNVVEQAVAAPPVYNEAPAKTVQAQPAYVQTASSVAAEIIPPEAVAGPVTVEDIQIKDSLLEEFSTEIKDTNTVTDEFTWDLDDLK
jgi:flagellar motor switch protein FliM